MPPGTSGWLTTPARPAPARCWPPSTSCGTPAAAASPSCSTRPGSSAAWPATARPATRCGRASRSGWSSATGLRDAAGAPLAAGAERRYAVGPDERRHVDPARWELAVPPAGGTGPLVVTFDRPLDHGLLARCLHVTGPGGAGVDGAAQAGPQERSWRLTPGAPWAAGPHRLVIDPVLEDLAGNSVSRVFDRDLSRPQDNPRPSGPYC